MSGRQSTSIALLDARGSGIVLSSIHHRDQARLYAKQVVGGRGRARALARGGGGDPRRRSPARCPTWATPAAPPSDARSATSARRARSARRRCAARPPARDAELVPFASIHEAVIAAVQRGDVDRALVPIENSLEGGGQRDARRARRGTRRDVVIVGERVLAIRNCLIAREALALEADRGASSRIPQPLAQCARFLRDELPRRRGARGRLDRRGGARPSPRRDEPWAALGPRGAAERYGCARAARGASTTSPATRRASSGSARAGSAAGRRPTAPAPWKTSVVFAGAGDAQPGWLVRCLSEFAFRGVNLTRIESRPQRGRLGHYIFHVDLEGAGRRAAGRRRDRRRSSAHCEDVRLLGTYPRARPGAEPDAAARARRLHFRRRSPMGSVTPPGRLGSAPAHRAPAARA